MKKVLLTLLLIFLFFLFGKPALAQDAQAVNSTWVDPSMLCHIYSLDVARGAENCIRENKSTKDIAQQIIDSCTGSGKVNLEGYTNASLSTWLYSISGEISPGLKTFCAPDNPLGAYLYKRTAIGGLSTLISGMYGNPPASSTYYAYNLLENIGLVKPAYAQGIGYAGLQALMPLWTLFRNLAYLIIVVILVAIGFLVMFRMKINPQTVISIQNALPNIVIALILITFSYAIAGFMIDLMYFAINVLVYVFAQVAPKPLDEAFVQSYYLNANIATLFDSTVRSHTIGDIQSAFLPADPTQWVGLGAAGAGIGALIGGIAGAGVGAVPGAIIGGLFGAGGISAIATILVLLAMLFVFVRLFFMLLTSYIQVILAVIFGPLQLVLGAIPGNKAFGNWIKSLLGNLIVFPTTAALFMLTNLISSLLLNQGNALSMWAPPFISGPSVDSNKILAALISFGMLMLIPTLVIQVKNAFAPKPALPISPAMMFAPIQQTFGTATSLGQQKYYAQYLPVIGGLFKPKHP